MLLLLVLLAWILVTLVRRQRRKKDMAMLAVAIKNRSSARSERTRTFLQAVYQLEDDELQIALTDIEKHESEFFQYLIDCLYRGSNAEMTTLDQSLDKMIESYKCLQPRVAVAPQQAEETVQEITTLRGENEVLRSELSVAKDKLSDLITEFGEIFGGGKDHQLTLQEVIDKVDAIKADHVDATALEVQK